MCDNSIRRYINYYFPIYTYIKKEGISLSRQMNMSKVIGNFQEGENKLSPISSALNVLLCNIISNIILEIKKKDIEFSMALFDSNSRIQAKE